jgi:hypothetical protein
VIYLVLGSITPFPPLTSKSCLHKSQSLSLNYYYYYHHQYISFHDTRVQFSNFFTLLIAIFECLFLFITNASNFDSRLVCFWIRPVMKVSYWKTKSGMVSCSRGTYRKSCRSRSTYTVFRHT